MISILGEWGSEAVVSIIDKVIFEETTKQTKQKTKWHLPNQISFYYLPTEVKHTGSGTATNIQYIYNMIYIYIYTYIYIYIYNTIWYNIYFINIKNNIKKKVYVRHSWFMLCCWKYCRLPIFINSFWWHYDGFARILETALLKQYKLRYFHFFKNKDSGMLLVLLI